MLPNAERATGPSSRLKKRYANGTLDSVGGASELLAMRDSADPSVVIDPSPVVEKLKLLARRRQEFKLARDMSTAFAAGDRVTATAMADELRVLMATKTEAVEVLTLQKTVECAYQYLVDFTENKRHVALGITTLDSIVGRIPAGSMTIIGGETGAGKSQTMLMMAMEMARAGNHPGIISLEDAREEWGGRAIARLTGITFRDFLAVKGRGADERHAVYAQAGKAVDESGNYQIDIAYAISASADSVLNTAGRLISERACNVLFVDYVQAVRIGKEWTKRIDKGFSDVAKQLKALSARAGVPLILGSQLARSKETPTIHSLKESGDLENEAEVVILLWKKTDGQIRWKLGKVKWAYERPNGIVTVNKTTGMIESFEETFEQETKDEY